MTDLQFEEVVFNGVPLFLPAYTLNTMTHCCHSVAGDARKHIYLETAHSDVMASWLAEGDATFLDIGAATGAMTVPFAIRFPGAGIYAFEPFHKVRNILTETLIKNRCGGPVVLDYALSSEPGFETFTAYEPDQSGNCPFLPETSSLGKLESDNLKNYFNVRVETVDRLMDKLKLTDNCVVKIDVEGWEGKVLEAAQGFIARYRPRFSIDIHPNPFGEGDTSDAVMACLEPYGYRFEKMGHVMICQRG